MENIKKQKKKTKREKKKDNIHKYLELITKNIYRTRKTTTRVRTI